MKTSVIKSCKVRLYPSKKQIEIIEKHFGCCRYVYNRLLAESIELYEKEKKSLSEFDMNHLITKWRHEEDTRWLADVSSEALQKSAKNIAQAYKNFFRRVKNHENPGFPKYKSKKNSRQSYILGRIDKYDFKHDNRRIKLVKLGSIKYKGRLPEGDIIMVTISKSPSGKYYLSACYKNIEVNQFETAGRNVGIDLGIKDFAIFSDGTKIENPKYFANTQKKLARSQRKLSRKTRGSKNKEKQRIKVARIHEKIANQRKDFLQKLSTKIIKNYDIICLVDLQVNNMIRNHKLAKSISDVSWSSFVTMLKYKAAWNDKRVIQIDKFYPSSQICSCCGFKNSDVKDLSIRQWTCPNCGENHDRDINPAKNILIEGLRIA